MNGVVGTLFVILVAGGIYTTNQIHDRDQRIVVLEAEVAINPLLIQKLSAQDREIASLKDTVKLVARGSKEETNRANAMRGAFIECERVVGKRYPPITQ